MKASGQPLSNSRTIVAISDFCGEWPPATRPAPTLQDALGTWAQGATGWQSAGDDPLSAEKVSVSGGYLERLPLACIRAGLVDFAEIWHHWRGDDPAPYHRDNAVLMRRGFRLTDERPPFHSDSMNAFIESFGAPHILCVWGLGVDASLLDRCARSFKIYNSIDAPSLRIPPDLAERFDLVVTAAEWQSREIARRHPNLATVVLPIGPEFADPETFRPLGSDKPYDVIYVAAAQPYKKHQLLFDSLAKSPRRLKALCVFGHGELANELRDTAAQMGLNVDFVGPPGVNFDEVNRLMNTARIGVVCGVEDGAPAILTEYMLAGLPVLANAQLRCGLQYILPETGRTAEAAEFHTALVDLIDAAPTMTPRDAVLARWTWQHSVRHLKDVITSSPKGSGFSRTIRTML